jgi:hypothetical protein
MRIGDKNLDQFEKEFDDFLNSFSDEELLKSLSKYLIYNKKYDLNKDVIISKNLKFETNVATDITFLINNIVPQIKVNTEVLKSNNDLYVEMEVA